MAGTIIGRKYWGMQRDSEGHRNFHITFLVEVDSKSDGPAVAFQANGLPVPGAVWAFSNDVDNWAWCQLDAEVEMEKQDPDCVHFHLTFHFSTRPLRFDRGHNLAGIPGFGDSSGGDLGPTDPLIEFPKVSGSFVKFTEEGTQDRFGRPIRTSSHEQIRGAQNEWDDQRPTIRIEWNTPLFEDVALVYSMRNCVNPFPLWGFDRRCIRLVPVSWERKFHGVVQQYFTIIVDFEINESTWDRDLLDEGTKVLQGDWDRTEGSATYHQYVPAVDENGEDLNPYNPVNFQRFKDWNDENARVVLNGAGLPFNPESSAIYKDTGFASPGGQTVPTTNTAGLSPPALAVTLEAGGSLVSGVTNGYAVTAVNATGESLPSNEASVTISNDNRTAALSWAGVEGATSYKVYRRRFGIASFDPDAADQSEYRLIAYAGSTSTPGKIHVEKYPEANFYLLNIPTIL